MTASVPGWILIQRKQRWGISLRLTQRNPWSDFHRTAPLPLIQCWRKPSLVLHVLALTLWFSKSTIWYFLYSPYNLIAYWLIGSQAAKQALTQKKKQSIEVIIPSALTIEQIHKLKLLKAKLQCSKGHYPWCWVASDGTHRVITIAQVSLWAQMIVHKILIDLNHITTN